MAKTSCYCVYYYSVNYCFAKGNATFEITFFRTTILLMASVQMLLKRKVYREFSQNMSYLISSESQNFICLYFLLIIIL